MYSYPSNVILLVEFCLFVISGNRMLGWRLKPLTKTNPQSGRIRFHTASAALSAAWPWGCFLRSWYICQHGTLYFRLLDCYFRWYLCGIWMQGKLNYEVNYEKCQFGSGVYKETVQPCCSMYRLVLYYN